MTKVRAWAALSAGSKLERYDYESDQIGDEGVEIAVEYCGLYHSDLSMIDNNLDASLRNFDEVLPAAGAVHSTVKLTPELMASRTTDAAMTATARRRVK